MAKCFMNQARKKITKINFLGPETAWWGGGLPCEGVVAKKFVLSLKSLGFEERNLGCPGNFAGMSSIPGVFKKFVQIKFVCIFRSLMKRLAADCRRPTATCPFESKIVFVFLHNKVPVQWPPLAGIGNRGLFQKALNFEGQFWAPWTHKPQDGLLGTLSGFS